MKETPSGYFLLLALLTTGLLPCNVRAKEITGVTVEPSVAKISAATGIKIKITIHADRDVSPYCGLRIEYGAGVVGEDIKIDDKAGLFPRVLMKTFTEPGTYTIKVAGKRITNHLPCPGKASAVLVVERAPTEKPREPSPPQQQFFRPWF